MNYHGDEAFPALSDEQWARLQACAGAILAAVLISSRDGREHADAARNQGAAAVAAAANPVLQPARVHRLPAARLPGQFGPGDAETTVRTLRAPRSWPQRLAASSARCSLGIR